MNTWNVIFWVYVLVVLPAVVIGIFVAVFAIAEWRTTW